jgi:hypothetical protein
LPERALAKLGCDAHLTLEFLFHHCNPSVTKPLFQRDKAASLRASSIMSTALRLVLIAHASATVPLDLNGGTLLGREGASRELVQLFVWQVARLPDERRRLVIEVSSFKRGAC